MKNKNVSEIKKILDIGCRLAGYDLTKECRRREFVDVRSCCYKIARDLGFTFQDIADVFNKNHATIVYFIQHFDDLYNQTPAIRTYYKYIKEYVQDSNPIEVSMFKMVCSLSAELRDAKAKISELETKVGANKTRVNTVGFNELYENNNDFKDKFNAFWNINKKLYQNSMTID